MTRSASPQGIITTHSALSVALPVENGEPPKIIQLLPMGRVKTRNGVPKEVFIEDRAHAEEIVQASVAYCGNTEPVIDYDHQTVRAPAVAGRAAAGGWMTRLFADDRGVWAEASWTASGAKQVVDREYRYISPCFRHRPDGRVTMILNAGLTNTPNLDLMALADAAPNDFTQEEDMKAIASALGLADDADEVAILAAIAANQDKADALTATASALGVDVGDDLTAVASAATALKASAEAAAPDPSKFVPVETVQELQSEMSALGTRVSTFEKGERDQLISAAMAEGKLTPALKPHAETILDTMALASFLSALHPTTLATASADLGKVATGDTLTESEKVVCASWGLTEEEYLASKKQIEDAS